MTQSPKAPPGTVEAREIVEVTGSQSSARSDLLAVEEPLEIRVVSGTGDERAVQPFSVTMRSPGHDFELAAGFLLAEGVISGASDIWRISRCESADEVSADNIVELHLRPEVAYEPERFRRNVYTSSSCGVCGKGSIEQLERLGGSPPSGDFALAAELVHHLPERLLSDQSVFTRTGGLHACGLITESGELELAREDVGRHNAVDKVVGRLLLDQRIPAGSNALLVSGRASFELVHKAMKAGITTLLAVGAPSSLAVETALAFGMTLVGFLRDGRFNIYAGSERIRGSQATHQ